MLLASELFVFKAVRKLQRLVEVVGSDDLPHRNRLQSVRPARGGNPVVRDTSRSFAAMPSSMVRVVRKPPHHTSWHSYG